MLKLDLRLVAIGIWMDRSVCKEVKNISDYRAHCWGCWCVGHWVGGMSTVHTLVRSHGYIVNVQFYSGFDDI